jgi:hypothetical protein
MMTTGSSSRLNIVPRRICFLFCLAAGAVHGALLAQPTTLPATWIDTKALKEDVLARPQRQDQAEQHQRNLTQRLTTKWLPSLQAAATAGDPFATWILHDCDALPDLPRAGIDSTCSDDLPARQNAQRVLEKSAVGAVAYRLRKLASAAIHGTIESGRCGKDDEQCKVQSAIQVLQEIRGTIVETGILPQLWAIRICPRRSSKAELGELDNQCEMLRQHLLAMNTLMRRYYSLSFSGEDSDAHRMSAYPYAFFGDVAPEGMKAHGTKDGAGLAFHSKFYADVYRDMRQAEANLFVRLAADPRWSAFFHESQAGLERPSPPPAARVKPRPNKKESLFSIESRAMHRFIGTYQGKMVSQGTSHAITKFYPAGNGGLKGRYLLFYGHGANARAEIGLLGPCTTRDPSELLCIWTDQFGVGDVSFVFNTDASEFKGLWGPLSADYGFHRMDKRYWNEMTIWGGTLQ